MTDHSSRIAYIQNLHAARKMLENALLDPEYSGYADTHVNALGIAKSQRDQQIAAKHNLQTCVDRREVDSRLPSFGVR